MSPNPDAQEQKFLVANWFAKLSSLSAKPQSRGQRGIGVMSSQSKPKKAHDENHRREVPDSGANLAVGWQRLIGPALAVSIVLFLYVLFQPLLVTRIAFIRWNVIVLAQVAQDLYSTDALLFVVVFGFGIVAPMAKIACDLVFHRCQASEALQQIAHPPW